EKRYDQCPYDGCPLHDASDMSYFLAIGLAISETVPAASAIILCDIVSALLGKATSFPASETVPMTLSTRLLARPIIPTYIATDRRYGSGRILPEWRESPLQPAPLS